MKKLENIQLSKCVSAYGGVGTIIETISNGSLKIESYDAWPCFNQQNIGGRVTDNRLLTLVKQSFQQFPQVNLQLYAIPTLDNVSVFSPRTSDLRQTIMADYFPTLFYCPNGKCRQIQTLQEWERDWGNKFPEDSGFRNNFPACCECSSERGRQISRRSLEQLRFVLVSLDKGEVKDIPIRKLWGRNIENNKVWRLDDNEYTGKIFYRTSSSGDGLQSIYIENEDHDRITMAEIHSRYIIIDEGAYRLEVKSANSLCYPNIARTIYIPIENPQATDMVQIGREEFQYLSDINNYDNSVVIYNPDLVVYRYPNLNLPKLISHISAVRRLKETSALLSYTRVEHSGSTKKWWSCQNNREEEMYPEKRIPFNRLNGFLKVPVVEAYGEGIFFELNLSTLQETFEIKEVFTHTLCHTIMKELEFQCGYPVSSLREKIYAYEDDETREQSFGFIIYTIAGSEGSYGGLVSLLPGEICGRDGKITSLINCALLRAERCPNDPICRKANGAHCFACLDIPEVSCTMYNTLLNRTTILKYKEGLITHQTTNQTTQETLTSEELG